jgi:hypothetical protein
MSARKPVRNVSDILTELYESITIKLKQLLNYNTQLSDQTLPREKLLELNIKMLELWIELQPMHTSIRENNPKGDMFFNSLDHEVEKYKKSAVNQQHKEEELGK